MEKEFDKKFDALIKDCMEFLIGEGSEEQQEKFEKYLIYMYISKAMPNLVRHWNSEYPEAKEEVVNIVKEIKTLNDKHREKSVNKNNS
jgi:Protein of unknown function (DUF2573)